MLGAWDWVVLGGYLATVAGVGFWAGRRESSTEDFFLGGRRQPWLIVGLSIIATEVSALTFIGVPATAFHGDWTYVQMYAGALIGRLLIIVFLLPVFYAHRVTTVYQYLGQRFGPRTQTTASVCFLSSRVIGSGIRLLAASLAVAEVFDWPVVRVILATATLAIAYTTFGGIKAIIWTDAVQAIVFIGGGVAALVYLAYHLPAPLAASLADAQSAGKFHLFTWKVTPYENIDTLFWLLVVSSTLTNMAALGTDQDLTQRMLTCPDVRRSRRSLIFNALAGLPIVCLFMLIGTMLFIYYRAGEAPLPDGLGRNRIFAYFIANDLPTGVGIKGLLLAGVLACAMSSLDSALGALSSSAVTDIYRRFFRPAASEAHYLDAARVFAFVFGVMLAGIAIAFASEDRVLLLWEALKWAGLVFGALLGVFLLGVLTKRRGADALNPWIMISSIAILVMIMLTQDRTGAPFVPWPWWIIIGTGWTFGLGLCCRTGHAPPTRHRARPP